MKHTKGPWIAAIDPGITTVDNNKCKVFASKSSFFTIIDGCEYSEGVANAHLIAAAPEMLEALEHASGIVEQAFFTELDKHGWQKDDNELPQHVRWLQKVHYEIRDAIAKAKGGAE